MSPGDPAAHLERLPGVLAATVFLDTPAPARVYAALSPDADPDTLRPAILGLLRDHGYTADPDNVHLAIAPIGRSVTDGVLPRVSLGSVEVQRSEGRVHCTVSLRAGDRDLAATASEPDTASGRSRAAARAALEGAEALDPDFRFGLEGVRRLDLFGEESLVVMVDAAAGRARARLVGAAILGRSSEETAALAVLQALRGWRP